MEWIDLTTSRQNGGTPDPEGGGRHMRIYSRSGEVIGELHVRGVDRIHALRSAPMKPCLPVGGIDTPGRGSMSVSDE